MTKVNGFQTGDQALILNAAGIQFGEDFFTNGDVVTVKVEDATVFGMNMGAHVYIVPVSGENPILSDNGGLVILGDELEAIAKVEDGGKIGNHDEITISHTFDDGKLHEHTPKFKKGERVLTMPGATVGTFGSVVDGEVYEITEVHYAGDGDFLYRMGHGRANFVGEDEIIRVNSDKIGLFDGMDAMEQDADLPKVEVGDIVRALPGASHGTHSVVDGEVYVVTLVEPFMGDMFYELGTDGSNGVYREEIELLKKASDDDDHIGNHAEEIEVGDLVRALPGAGDSTQSVVDGKVYEVTEKRTGMFGGQFYELGDEGGNAVYREEIELVSKGAK